MAYQHPHQHFTSTSQLSAPNTHTLPPALLQALHRLATFSSDIQLLTSHFAPHLAYHPCFLQPTPRQFPRRRKPTTRSTAWRLQHLLCPDPITQLPAVNASLSPSIATPITNAPPRPASVPPVSQYERKQNSASLIRSCSTPPRMIRSRLREESNNLTQYNPTSENASQSRSHPRPITVGDLTCAVISTPAPTITHRVACTSIHLPMKTPQVQINTQQLDLIPELTIHNGSELVVTEPQTTTTENLEWTAVVSPLRVSSDLVSATKNNSVLNAIEPAVVSDPDPVIEDLISSAANDHALNSAVGCLTTGDINQDTITDIDQNRTVDLVLNVEKGLANDVDQELETTKIVALNDPLRLPVASLMKSVTTFAVDRSVDLGDTKAGNHGHAADVHPDPDATTNPVLDDLVSIQSETNHPQQVFISDIHLGSNLDMLSSPQPYHIAHPVASSTNIPLPLMNKKKKKKKKKKKTPSIDNDSSEQHCSEYDVTDNFGFCAPNGWIEDHHHSSNHSPSLQQDTHTLSETNYDHLLGLVHQLLFRHHMYDLLQVDEQGILLGKEYGQHIQNQDVICYSHEGEFMFRRTKDGKIFDYLDVLEY
ncbi:hypothetical protein DFH28DRAFT_1197066 [Melampsora americana]|nr:hypothetical protein DFH28DRAFT_1197066 [Melampsora americana]